MAPRSRNAAARPSSADLFADQSDETTELDDLEEFDPDSDTLSDDGDTSPADSDDSSDPDDEADAGDEDDDEGDTDEPGDDVEQELIVPGLDSDAVDEDDDEAEPVARPAATEDDEDDDEGDDPDLAPIRPRGADEFCCPGCFLVKPLVQQSDAGLCRDCD